MRLLVATALIVLATTGSAAAQVPPAPTPPPVPAPAPVPVPEPTVQPGVVIADIPVEGQTRAQVRQTLRDELRPRLRKPVVLRSGEEVGKLSPRATKQRLDAARTARRALAADPGMKVKPALSFRREPIRAFVAGYARRVFVAPVDARVDIRVRRMRRVPAKPGERLAAKHVVKRIRRVLRHPARSRRLDITLVRAEPAVRGRDLPARYPTVITIDKSTFTLRLFRRLRYERRYGVAIGQPAYPTPTGLFAIQSKQVNPTWTAPDSPWAGESAGQSYAPGDPGNPLAARWMGVSGSVGIHGTYQEYSIGTAASHGCIRMRASDVIDLFGRVSIGTPVLIAN